MCRQCVTVAVDHTKQQHRKVPHVLHRQEIWFSFHWITQRLYYKDQDKEIEDKKKLGITNCLIFFHSYSFTFRFRACFFFFFVFQINLTQMNTDFFPPLIWRWNKLGAQVTVSPTACIQLLLMQQSFIQGVKKGVITDPPSFTH